jgi:hypothetical protein
MERLANFSPGRLARSGGIMGSPTLRVVALVFPIQLPFLNPFPHRQLEPAAVTALCGAAARLALALAGSRRC